MRFITIISLMLSAVSFVSAASEPSVAVPTVQLSVHVIGSVEGLEFRDGGGETFSPRLYSNMFSRWQLVQVPLFIQIGENYGPKLQFMGIADADEGGTVPEAVMLLLRKHEDGIEMIPLEVDPQDIRPGSLFVVNTWTDTLTGEFGSQEMQFEPKKIVGPLPMSPTLSIKLQNAAATHHCTALFSGLSASSVQVLVVAPPQFNGSPSLGYRLLRVPSSLRPPEP